VALAFDAGVVIIAALAVFAESRRGLAHALVDVARVILAVAAGLGAAATLQRLTRSPSLALAGFVAVALFVVLATAWLAARSRTDPRWGRGVAGRVGAGLIGLGLGLAICATFVPAVAQLPAVRERVGRARLAQAFLEFSPWLYRAADLLNASLPTLGATARRFEDEGRPVPGRLVERINYSQLDGSTCIECGAAVRFEGYRRRFTVSVSPLFRCPNCGRTSDGCQTFEGFHRMYGRCPTDVADSLGPIDCGVWPNSRPVVPHGSCPVCSRTPGG
jgi:multisubunit Na+/H+ antiporter MnhB subunit